MWWFGGEINGGGGGGGGGGDGWLWVLCLPPRSLLHHPRPLFYIASMLYTWFVMCKSTSPMT